MSCAGNMDAYILGCIVRESVTVTEALVLHPPIRRPRMHHRVGPYLGARRRNETEMFSDHDETSSLIAAISAPSVACSMLAVQQRKRLCRQFVDVSADNEVATR